MCPRNGRSGNVHGNVHGTRPTPFGMRADVELCGALLTQRASARHLGGTVQVAHGATAGEPDPLDERALVEGRAPTSDVGVGPPHVGRGALHPAARRAGHDGKVRDAQMARNHRQPWRRRTGAQTHADTRATRAVRKRDPTMTCRARQARAAAVAAGRRGRRRSNKRGFGRAHNLPARSTCSRPTT